MKELRALFKGYRHNRMLLDRKRRELESMAEITDTVRGSSAEWPYVQQTMTVSGRNAAEETRIMEEIRQLEQACGQVENALRKAPNSTVRLMLELKYVDGLRWEEVAQAMGEDVSGDAMRKREEAFFEGLEVSSENS